MFTDQEIELAHPDAFDFAFGNLPAAKSAEFSGHLSGCVHCQRVVEEYSGIGWLIKSLPPHGEPSADLEDRTVAAMAAALAESEAEADRLTDTASQLAPVPRSHPSPGQPPAPQPPQARAMVTRLPLWRRHPRLLAAAVAAAAAIIVAAIVVPLSLGGDRITPAQAAVVIPLHVTAAGKAAGYGAATGQAAARQGPSGSWSITLKVAHLKHFDPQPWYGCWYVSRDGRQVASAGTFLVPGSGSATLSMTSAVDPHDFPAMEITLGPPGKNGALAGTVILSGQAL